MMEKLIHLQTSFDFGAARVLTSLTSLLPESDPILAEKQKLDFRLIQHIFKITHVSRSFKNKADLLHNNKKMGSQSNDKHTVLSFS